MPNGVPSAGDAVSDGSAPVEAKRCDDLIGAFATVSAAGARDAVRSTATRAAGSVLTVIDAAGAARRAAVRNARGKAAGKTGGRPGDS